MGQALCNYSRVPKIYLPQHTDWRGTPGAAPPAAPSSEEQNGRPEPTTNYNNNNNKEFGDRSRLMACIRTNETFHCLLRITKDDMDRLRQLEYALPVSVDLHIIVSVAVLQGRLKSVHMARSARCPGRYQRKVWTRSEQVLKQSPTLRITDDLAKEMTLIMTAEQTRRWHHGDFYIALEADDFLSVSQPIHAAASAPASASTPVPLSSQENVASELRAGRTSESIAQENDQEETATDPPTTNRTADEEAKEENDQTKGPQHAPLSEAEDKNKTESTPEHASLSSAPNEEKRETAPEHASSSTISGERKVCCEISIRLGRVDLNSDEAKAIELAQEEESNLVDGAGVHAMSAEAPAVAGSNAGEVCPLIERSGGRDEQDTIAALDQQRAVGGDEARDMGLAESLRRVSLDKLQLESLKARTEVSRAILESGRVE